MKKKYLKTMNECQDYPESESIIEKVFTDEMILENIYKLQMNLAEYLTQKDFYDSKSELTIQEINRLEQQLNC